MTLLEAVPMSPDLLILLEAVAVTVNWLCLEGDTSLDTYPDSILKRMSHYHYDQVCSKSVIILGQKGFSWKKLIDYAISVFFWFSIKSTLHPHIHQHFQGIVPLFLSELSFLCCDKQRYVGGYGFAAFSCKLISSCADFNCRSEIEECAS